MAASRAALIDANGPDQSAIRAKVVPATIDYLVSLEIVAALTL
jgi:hypothetical protein